MECPHHNNLAPLYGPPASGSLAPLSCISVRSLSHSTDRDLFRSRLYIGTFFHLRVKQAISVLKAFYASQGECQCEVFTGNPEVDDECGECGGDPLMWRQFGTPRAEANRRWRR